MITTIVFDFSRVLLFPKDERYTASLNELYRTIRTSETYDFFSYFVLNTELLEYIKHIGDNYSLVIFTSESIQNDPAVKQKTDTLFTAVLSAKELQLKKSETHSYTRLAELIESIPEHILYIDDNRENISAATAAGFQTILYTDNASLYKAMEDVLKK